MLYKKNGSPKLDQKLFENPTAEYRGTPFWAWTCELKKEELLWQMEVLKKMGFGGGHMHVRTGMATPYLSDEYMDLIKACVEKAKAEEMLAWLYRSKCLRVKRRKMLQVNTVRDTSCEAPSAALKVFFFF